MDPCASSPARHLRIASGAAWAEHRANTALLLEVGNARFADHLRSAGEHALRGTPYWPVTPQAYVVLHSWRPGLLWVDVAGAAAILAFRESGPPPGRDLGDQLQGLGWLEPGPLDLDQLVQTAVGVLRAMQNRTELRELLRRLQVRPPRTVLEIGTARGGTLFALAQVAAADALLVSVDLPGGRGGGGQTPREQELFRAFGAPRQRVRCVSTDTGAPDALARVSSALEGRPVDLLLVDGDHTESAVRRDLALFGPLLAADGLAALHDISPLAEHWGPAAGVSTYWRSLPAPCRTGEIVDPAGWTRPHPPQGRRAGWGFGLLDAAACARAVRGCPGPGGADFP